MKTYTIDGRQFTVNTDNLDGLCELPGDDACFVLWVNPQTRGKNRLNTFIHEALHGGLNSTDEELVTNLADFVADILWDQGYRQK